MAAGFSTFHIANPRSVNNFLCSPSPFSSGKRLTHNVRLSLSRLTTCSSSLLITGVPRRESEDFLKMESAFSSLFLSVKNSFDDGTADSLGVNQIIRSPWDPWDILQAGREEDAKQDSGAFSAPLGWRDASLQYANVMWFKGSYNAEIICREDEPEESLVRRFRQAVSRAGVIRECQRRRYRETKQDTIKRKQRMASFDRKRVKGSTARTENVWKLSRDHLKPVHHSKKKKKKKSSRRFSEQPRFDATKNSGSDKKTDDTDDDYWGFADEAPRGEEEASKRS